MKEDSWFQFDRRKLCKFVPEFFSINRAAKFVWFLQSLGLKSCVFHKFKSVWGNIFCLELLSSLIWLVLKGPTNSW